MKTKRVLKQLGPVRFEYLPGGSDLHSRMRGMGVAILRCRRWRLDVRFPGIQSTDGYDSIPGDTAVTTGWVWLSREKRSA